MSRYSISAEAWERLKGVCPVEETLHVTAYGMREFTIRDPNGYGVELLYELPREVWAGDIDASVNYYVAKPTEGPAALEDRVEEYKVFAAARTSP